MDYVVCKERILGDLEEAVQQHIMRGFVPVGGILSYATTTQSESNPRGGYRYKTTDAAFYQAMYKAPTKKKPKARASKALYPEDFESLWAARPKRSGSNPKSKAYSACLARIKEGVTYMQLFNGLDNYSSFCEITNVEPQYVMQAATFFGPDKHYENDWTIPTAPDNVPRDNDKLEAFALEHGYRLAWSGETFTDWRKALEKIHRKENRNVQK